MKEKIEQKELNDMPSSLIMKNALAEAIKCLLEEKSLSAVSVKNIADYCNISRNTFYYHFKDKYELINWMFCLDLTKNLKNQSKNMNLSISFINVCNCLHANRKFYLSCFQYLGQNSLYSTIYNIYYELWKKNITVIYNDKNIDVSETEIEMISRMKAHSIVGIISDWVNAGMHSNYMTCFEQVENILNNDSLNYINYKSQKAAE